jgi:hypothetical protein
MSFLFPAMLWGALVIGVPIIIYLINRRRFQRRVWAAMEFLLRALKKNRRRLQLENLLLLLLRVAALLLLAVAMARPYLRNTAIGLLSEKNDNWIFALDTSYSMGFKDGPRSLFDRARESITAMVQDLVKKGDRLAIATLDADPQVVLGPTWVTESNRPELLRDLAEVPLTPRSVDLTQSLVVLRDLAARFEPSGEKAALQPKKIILFSDFQRRDWLGDDGRPRDPAAQPLIKEIQDAGGEFKLGRLNDSDHSDRNLSLLDLSVSPEVVAKDVWVELHATIRNWSKEDFDSVELKFHIDGQEEAGLVLRVPAGETVNAPAVPFRFTEAGYHSVVAEVRSDGLWADNRRYLAVRVREEAGILLVDGEPGGGPRDRETLYLLAALSPDSSEAPAAAEGRLTPYKPLVKSDHQLEELDLRDQVCVVLANVSELPDRFQRELEAYVRDGGALMVFLGKNVSPLYYNQELFRQGQGLLPLKLDEVRGDARSSFHLVPGESDHPLVRYFDERRDVTSIFQDLVEFRQFYRAVAVSSPPGPPEGAAASSAKPGGPPEGAAATAPASTPGKAKGPDPARLRIPFRLSDPEGSPAVFDAGFGHGRTLWIASTADTEWNDLPKWPDFVAFLYQAIPYLVRFGETRINLSVGEPFRQVFEAADYAQEVTLIPPGADFSSRPLGESAGSIQKAMTKLEGENRFMVSHEETAVPGIYELRLRSLPGGSPAPLPEGSPAAARPSVRQSRQFFAVNLDPREGDLRALSPGELKEHFPSLKAQVFDAARELREIGQKKSLARGTELWRAVLWGALGLLLLETALAQLFGRNQR